LFLSDKLRDFYFNLQLNQSLPDGVEVMNPYNQLHVREVCSQFFKKYFSDINRRILILGINPGRFGAGVTGITFTDPIRLESECGILNDFRKKPEVSSVFIYDMIRKFGGPSKFYSHFILSAICPLGFISSGKNINYYDSRQLSVILKDFITDTLKQQVFIAGYSDKVICLGQGRNYEYLKNLNKEYDLFNEIISLPHPRWIMQYRFKKKVDYINEYIRTLQGIKDYTLKSKF
jgi:hypothetical protein